MPKRKWKRLRAVRHRSVRHRTDGRIPDGPNDAGPTCLRIDAGEVEPGSRCDRRAWTTCNSSDDVFQSLALERSLIVNQIAYAAPIAFASDPENVGSEEESITQELAQTLKMIVKKVNDDLGHASRGVHAKSHAILRGELGVHPDLPPELAQGIFAVPRRYDAIVRISSIAGDILSDSISLPRGFAIKVFGVDGDRLSGGEESRTQDFLLASGVAFSNPDTKGFLDALKLLEKTTDKAQWAKSALSAVLRPLVRLEEKVGLPTGRQKALGGYPESNPVGERYGTQAAYRFGAYVAKLDIVPASNNFLALKDEEFAVDGRENAIRDEMVSLLATEGGAWTLRVQLRRDASANPVEDASIAWPEESNPYLPVATLTVKAQTAWSPDRSHLVDDEMAFSPWQGIMAHQPLGMIGRARRYVYPVLSAYRGSLNGCPIQARNQPPDFGPAS